MKKFLQEFKEFATKGSMFDMAVGLIMGTAFSGLVTKFVDCIITPILGIVSGGASFDSLVLSIGNFNMPYGELITAIINFIFQALVLFMLVKSVNKLRTSVKKPVEEAPKTKICPYCFSEIPIKATRCPHCTSELTKSK